MFSVARAGFLPALATHRTWLPDTADLDRFDKVTFPLPHDFCDKYTNREAAKVQDMTIAKTMRMGYDLKMFLMQVRRQGRYYTNTPLSHV